MFIGRLVEKANKSTNTKEATKIRRNLINLGMFGIILGIVGVIISMFLFTTFVITFLSDLEQFNTTPNFSLLLLPSTIIFPSLIAIVLGVMSLISGLSLVIVQKTSEFIDENVYCPVCNNMTGNDRFCNQCGASVLSDRICEKCKTLNKVDANFCKGCGSKL